MTEIVDKLWVPMKFAEVDLCLVNELVDDPEWVFEQKFDGTRGLCVITPTGVWWPGKNGVGNLSHTAATQHFKTLNPILHELIKYGDFEWIVLDGEIMVRTGEYFVWDVVYLKQNGMVIINPDNSDLRTRRHILETLFELLPVDGPVKLVRQARTFAEKNRLWDAVKNGGGEGIMAKQLNSKYDLGKRVEHTVKFKFVKTADVVILSVNRPDHRHGNFVLGAYDKHGKITWIGSCSAIGKDKTAKPGDVIEVAYLYWSGGMIQPRMIKIRDDKAPEDCLISQFPEYTRVAR